MQIFLKALMGIMTLRVVLAAPLDILMDEKRHTELVAGSSNKRDLKLDTGASNKRDLELDTGASNKRNSELDTGASN